MWFTSRPGWRYAFHLATTHHHQMEAMEARKKGGTCWIGFSSSCTLLFIHNQHTFNDFEFQHYDWRNPVKLMNSKLRSDDSDPECLLWQFVKGLHMGDRTKQPLIWYSSGRSRNVWILISSQFLAGCPAALISPWSPPLIVHCRCNMEVACEGQTHSSCFCFCATNIASMVLEAQQ